MARLAFAWRMLKDRWQDERGLAPYCESRFSMRLQRRHLLIEARKCLHCGLIYRWPTDPAEGVRDFYESAYEGQQATTLPDGFGPDGDPDAEFSPAHDKKDRIVFLDRTLGPAAGRSLLDFGCSWGYSVRQYQAAGWRASGIVAGAVLIAASMYQMTNVYGDLGFWYMARSRMLLGVGLPLIFVPIMAASYDGIAQSKTDQASALINAARNTGSSIGVSIVSNVLTHRQQFHQSRLVESVLPSSVQYQDTLHRVTDYFVTQGSSFLQAQQQAIQWIGQQVQAQASFLAYRDAFWGLILNSLPAGPLALTLPKCNLG